MLEVVVSGLVTGFALTAAHAVTSRGSAREARPMPAPKAYVLFAGITAVNPATVVYFAAVVLGNQRLVTTAAQGAAFVAAAFLASASWQLLLAGGGAALGAVVTSHRGRLVTGLVSAAVIALLALHTMLA